MFNSIRVLIRSSNALLGFHHLGLVTLSPCCISNICGRSPLHLVSFGTMPSKKKKPSMALLYEDSPVEGGESDAITPSVTPRRSIRNQKNNRDEGLRLRGKPQKPSQGLQENGRPEGVEKLTPRSLSTKMEKSTIENPGSVKRAMEKLREMEDRFNDTTKRQKRMVDESLVQAPKTEEIALYPRPQEANPPSMSPTMEKKGLDQMDPVLGEDQEGNPLPVPLVGQDPEVNDLVNVPEENDINLIKKEGARPPPVNSDYLPLPWKGRLGYACLNTYLRQANTPVFSSRTCRIASILEHRHPLQDPSQPEHATKNRPNQNEPADVARGQKYVENLGLANARDIIKMLRWNDKYGIKFLRLSSEMFPFASHAEYGYKLEPFAAKTLAEAGRVAAELGHRVTTHPGQFTQLGSPRPEVIQSAIRDLEYHDEMLTLLRLPEQQNKDAVMIIHMGGMYGDKGATLDRFRSNYVKLSPSIKARLVLENDDVSWTVHDLLPVCEELNIPMVLDFHHHNILFDADKLREGTKDIVDLYPRIKATWDRKGITQKMHYSEPCPEAVTPRQRRKHSPRVMTLPPCPPDMDLMIEAKDKEQAVLTLMRNFRLPGWDRFHDVIPYEREDENKPAPKALPMTKKQQQQQKKKKKKTPPQDKKVRAGEDLYDYEGEALLVDEEVDEEEPKPPPPPPEVPESEIGMGGPHNRVFWPVGMEEWLRPKKREVKKKTPAAGVNVEEESLKEKTAEAKTKAKPKSKPRKRKKKGEEEEVEVEDDNGDDE